MTFRELRDVIHYLIELHREVADQSEIAAEKGEERVSMLARSIAEKEKPTFGRLEALEKDERIGILENWVQFIPTDDVDRARSELRQAALEAQEKFPEKVLHLHQEIIIMLKSVADKINAPMASGLVEELGTFELQILQQLQITREMQYDL
jgi:hypothetical protein